MNMNAIPTIILTLALCLFCTGAYAQENGSDDRDEETSDSGPDDDNADPSGPGLTSGFDDNPAARIAHEARRFCRGLADETYRIDCLAERIRAAANAVPRTPEMAPARRALLKAAADLDRTVARYRDRGKPPVRARRGGATPVQPSRPLVAVREPDLAAAKAQALQILDETETVLLRAADRSAERALSYQQIAAAVGSNKVLLRS